MNLPVIPITIRKGETFISFWEIEDINNQKYILEEGDSVIFGVKRNVESTDYLIKKIYTRQNIIDQGIYINLTSEETQNLTPSVYQYDIGIKLNDSTFFHLTAVSPFIVMSSITFDEG